MARHHKPQTRFVGSFIAAMVLAYWLAHRENASERIRSEIASSLGMAGGLFAGYKLADRSRSKNATQSG